MPLAFYHVLANNLVANVTNFTVWFGITFWIFLETQSVFATGMIAGMYLIFTAGFGFWFGGLVAFNSRYYRQLSAAYLTAPDDNEPGGAAPAATPA